jgi:hypothetical protein
MSGAQASSYLIVLIRPKACGRSHSGAGALSYRDFSGLLAAKENRTGSRQTLLPNATTVVLRHYANTRSSTLANKALMVNSSLELRILVAVGTLVTSTWFLPPTLFCTSTKERIYGIK